MNKLVITGGCGFVGHHFVEHFIKATDWKIVVLDKLTYTTDGYNRIRDINCFDEKRVSIFSIDLTLPISYGVSQEIGEVDYIINIASESHVDNSIADPVHFIKNNVDLVLNLLEWARGIKGLKRFIQFSTDEVYGTAPEGISYKEGDRLNPGNPYSASKAAQESIVRAYANTFNLPIQITNTMNVIGERQHPEKFIPLVINKTLKGETVTIHADKEKLKAGTRFYVHARNVARAVDFILQNTDDTLDKIDAASGQYHIVGEKEIDNLSLATMIAKFVGKPLQYEMVDFHSSRPGHDLRYAIDGTKLKEKGFYFSINMEDSLEKTVSWFMNNREWLGKES